MQAKKNFEKVSQCQNWVIQPTPYLSTLPITYVLFPKLKSCRLPIGIEPGKPQTLSANQKYALIELKVHAFKISKSPRSSYFFCKTLLHWLSWKQNSKPNFSTKSVMNTLQTCINIRYDYLQVWMKVIDSSFYGGFFHLWLVFTVVVFLIMV